MQQFEKEMLDGISEYSNELDNYLRFEVGQPIEVIYQQEDCSLCRVRLFLEFRLYKKDEFKGHEALLRAY